MVGEISVLQMKYKCSFSDALKTINMIEHITQTKAELQEILEKEDKEELERYLIEYFKNLPRVTMQ